MKGHFVSFLGGVLGALLIAPLLSLAADWYVATGRPAQRSALSSSDLRSEFASIQTGIADKMPLLAGHGGAIVRVNSGGTALEADSGSGTFTAPISVGCASPINARWDYAQAGNVVTLTLDNNGGACTSSGTTFATAAGAVPASLRPSYTVQSPLYAGFLDDGANTTGCINIAADGTMTFDVCGTTFFGWSNFGALRSLPSTATRHLSFSYTLGDP